MKKALMMSIMALVVFSACGQKLSASKVPQAVKTSFEKQYPDISPKWEKEDGKYEATFKQSGKTMSAMFTPAGIFTESETAIKTTELPASISTYVKEHYTGKTIKGAAKITKQNGIVNYEVVINGKDVMFDANGKFLEEEKD